MENEKYFDIDEFNSSQWSELVRGLSNGVDITYYADPAYSSYHMRKIREVLFAGKDCTALLKKDLSPDEVGVLHFALMNDLEYQKYLDSGFSAQQIHEIQMGIMDGIDVSPIEYSYYTPEQMYQIKRGIKAGIDTKIYENPHYSPTDMGFICAALIEGLPVQELIGKDGSLPIGFPQKVVEMNQKDRKKNRRTLVATIKGLSMTAENPEQLFNWLEIIGYEVTEGAQTTSFIPPKRNYQIIIEATREDFIIHLERMKRIKKNRLEKEEVHIK